LYDLPFREHLLAVPPPPVLLDSFQNKDLPTLFCFRLLACDTRVFSVHSLYRTPPRLGTSVRLSPRCTYQFALPLTFLPVPPKSLQLPDPNTTVFSALSLTLYWLLHAVNRTFDEFILRIPFFFPSVTPLLSASLLLNSPGTLQLTARPDIFLIRGFWGYYGCLK